jgi:DNA-binding transcriptional LysR family regulator
MNEHVDRFLAHRCISPFYRTDLFGPTGTFASALILEDDALMIQAAKDGAGIAYVYEELARDEVRNGYLREILQEWKAPPSRFFLYYSSRRHVPPALKALIEFIRARDLRI